MKGLGKKKKKNTVVSDEKLTVSAYMTLAPPPATMVHMRPLGFKTVNFRDALV